MHRTLALAATTALLAACGGKNLEDRVAEERAAVAARPGPRAGVALLTEAEKIARLIELVRDSGLTFVRNGQPHSSAEAAEHMAMKLERAGDRVRTAEEFIVGVASKSSLSGQPYTLRLPDGREIPTRDWLLERLRELEVPPAAAPASGPAPGPASGPPAAAPAPPPALGVERVLELIESSGLEFHALDDDGVRATWNASEFARMLRRKSRWLGPDLRELEPWLAEIASRSFRTDRDYEVQLDTGERVRLRVWLDQRVAAERAAAQ
jgi:hypothetical protein